MTDDMAEPEKGSGLRDEEHLLQAQKMEAIGRLTGGIAHDFNNLLNVILGNVELIALHSTDARIQRLASTARDSTLQGARLVGQLLAFSRGGSRDPQPVNLAQLMEGVRELLAASLRSNIRLRLEADPGMPQVCADANCVQLALLHLAINARDAMPEGGTMAIRCALRRAPAGLLPDGEYGVVSVSDDGAGAAPDLSQVCAIVTQSGGTARIESRAGKGTTVEIWLPLAR